MISAALSDQCFLRDDVAQTEEPKTDPQEPVRVISLIATSCDGFLVLAQDIVVQACNLALLRRAPSVPYTPIIAA